MALLTGRRLERARASRQFHDGKFRNTSGLGAATTGSFFGIAYEFFFKGKARSPSRILPVESPLEAWQTPPQSGLRITWFGHSTVLIEIDGVRVLTDPVFGERASPYSWVGPKRFHPVPATIDQLPPLDAILLSHDHHDHLNPWSWRELATLRVPIVTSLGVGARLEKLGIADGLITELDWYESHVLPGTALTFTATPAQHFSGRGLTDRNLTLWSSFVLETPEHNVYFGADSGLTTELADIGARFGPFDISMLEIGAWDQAWDTIHLGPAGALKAFEMLGKGTLLPIHWGTFDLALHKWDEPPETLLKLASPEVRILTPPIGRAFEPALVESLPAWWRGVG